MDQPDPPPFAPGDLVRNVHKESRYYHRIGRFHAYLPWYFQQGEEGLRQGIHQGCEVHYSGQRGPYDYPYIAQRVGDLVLIRRAKERSKG